MTPDYKLILGDNVAELRAFAENSVDAVVTDPPYGLSQEPDMAEVLRHWLAGDDYIHRGGGFMGKTWDSFVPGPTTWREVHRVLKPGAYALVFAGTRTHGLMEVALRLAGFEIRDAFDWIYGSGFPKSLDISKAIDKAAGAKRDVVGTRVSAFGDAETSETSDGRNLWAKPATREVPLTGAPVTENARTWEGWGTALKPAHEPIIVARKPVEGTVAANVLKYGTGGINIDGCRVPASTTESGTEGRWPPNILLTHDPNCTADGCVDGCPVMEMDRQSGTLTSGEMTGMQRGWGKHGIYGEGGDTPAISYADSGGASRFFPIFRFEPDDHVSFLYCAKAARKEREAGCENLHVRSGAEAVEREEGSAGLKSPRAGAGRTAAEVRNFHPTVKPIALARWLVRLVAPPGGLVLDPFMGSGTTGVAAKAETRRFVGIEVTPEYLPIAEARIGAERSEASAPPDPSQREVAPPLDAPRAPSVSDFLTRLRSS